MSRKAVDLFFIGAVLCTLSITVVSLSTAQRKPRAKLNKRTPPIELKLTPLTLKQFADKGDDPNTIASDIGNCRKIIETATDWREFWRRASVDKPLTVDFRKYRVVVIGLGDKPNPGYGIRIEKAVYLTDKKITQVALTYLVPNPAMGYIDVIVYPVAISLVPKKPGDVRFVDQTKQSPAE